MVKLETIDEVDITKKIVEGFHEKFLSNIEVDVAIAGAGSSGLAAARYIAKNGKKVAIFERKLSIGGGIWGGGMGYPIIVIREKSLPILKDVGVKFEDAGDGYYTADSIELASKLSAGAIDAGAAIFNGISVEDVILQNERIKGVVINWSSIGIAGLHVDPLSIGAKVVIDATGHDCEVCKVVQKKVGRLNTPSGKIEGEEAMWAESGEKAVVENTKEVYPGLYATGMAASAVFGSPRMGPIFGGMLLSGKRVAELVLEELENGQV